MTTDLASNTNDAVETSDDVRSVADSLRILFQAIRLHNVNVERQLGISLAQLYVLERLAETGVCCVNDLAAMSRTHQSSVSVVVRKLVERGLVVRGVSPVDARRAELALSESGRELLARAPSSLQTQLAEGLERLGPSRTRVLANVLGDWLALCGLRDATPPMFGEDEPQSQLLELGARENGSSLS